MSALCFVKSKTITYAATFPKLHSLMQHLAPPPTSASPGNSAPTQCRPVVNLFDSIDESVSPGCALQRAINDLLPAINDLQNSKRSSQWAVNQRVSGWAVPGGALNTEQWIIPPVVLYVAIIKIRWFMIRRPTGSGRLYNCILKLIGKCLHKKVIHKLICLDVLLTVAARAGSVQKAQVTCECYNAIYK